jgi:hypothetical protein
MTATGAHKAPVPCQNIDPNTFGPRDAVSGAANAAPHNQISLVPKMLRRLTPTDGVDGPNGINVPWYGS